MKKIAHLLRWTFLLGLPLVSWAALTANLDETFGTGGIVVDDVSYTSDDYPNAIIIDENNKILIAGKTTTGSDADFFVQRYNSAGVLDTSFGSSGTKSADFGTSVYESANDMAILSDGHILLVGATPSNFALAMFTADGDTDDDFGSEGKVTTNIGSSDYAYAVAVSDDDEIYVVGSADDNIAVTKYTADGDLDTSFDDDGILLIDIGGQDTGRDASFTSDGSLVIAGTTTLTSTESCDDCSAVESSDIVVLKLNASGELASTFGNSGIVTTDLETTDDVSALAIQDDGKILVAGSSLVRYKTTGTLDTSFSSDGAVTLSDFTASDITLNSDDEIIVTGFVSNTSKDFAFSVFSSSGTLDTSLGNDGVVAVDINDESDDYPSAMALDDDDNLTITGRTESDDEIDAALVRFEGLEDSSTSSSTSTDTSSQSESAQSSAGGCSLVRFNY